MSWRTTVNYECVFNSLWMLNISYKHVHQELPRLRIFWINLRPIWAINWNCALVGIVDFETIVSHQQFINPILQHDYLTNNIQITQVVSIWPSECRISCYKFGKSMALYADNEPSIEMRQGATSLRSRHCNSFSKVCISNWHNSHVTSRL